MAVKVAGKVTSVFAGRRGTLIKLDIDPSQEPKGEYFRLPLDHANYNGLYSLALAAAANRWTLGIRIAGDGQIDPNVEADIMWLAVDWKAGAVHPD
jgi:hypothetical protein